MQSTNPSWSPQTEGGPMQIKVPDFNLNHLRVFMAVYQSGGMTKAAEQLHLTQSGVSQHIQALERDLGIPLFNRVGRNLIPTDQARTLMPDLEKAFSAVTDRLLAMTGKAQELQGVVRIGLPIEYGTTVIVPKLAEIGKKYPKISFEITLDYGSVLVPMVLAGKLDFAVIDEAPTDRRIIYKPVASEELHLCCLKDYLNGKPKPKYHQSYFEELDYVEYKGLEPILRRWMLHHLKRKNLRLNVRAHIMDVQGVAKFIISGLGVGVLPDHVVARLKKDGVNLYVFEGKAKPLRNEIRLICLRNETMPTQAKLVFANLSH